MTIQELITATRRILDDEIVPYKWPDAELVDYYNDAMSEIAQQTDAFIDPSTTAVVDIAITEDTYDYAISPLILEIHSAKINGQTKFLAKTTAQRMNDRIPNWRSNDSNISQYYLLDYRTDYITLYPKPNADGTINLTVSKLPATVTTANLTVSPELRDIYHAKLRDGIAKYAYLKSGETTYNDKKAAVHMALFKSLINEIKLAFIRLQQRRKRAAPHRGMI